MLLPVDQVADSVATHDAANGAPHRGADPRTNHLGTDLAADYPRSDPVTNPVANPGADLVADSIAVKTADPGADDQSDWFGSKRRSNSGPVGQPNRNPDRDAVPVADLAPDCSADPVQLGSHASG